MIYDIRYRGTISDNFFSYGKTIKQFDEIYKDIK